MEEKRRPFGPERPDLRKAYVYDGLEGTRVLSEGITPVDDRTLLEVHFPENRVKWFVKSTNPKIIDAVKRQLQAKGVTTTEDEIILERVIPASVNLLKRTGQFKEERLDRTLRLDRVP